MFFVDEHIKKVASALHLQIWMPKCLKISRCRTCVGVFRAGTFVVVFDVRLLADELLYEGLALVVNHEVALTGDLFGHSWDFILIE